MNPPNPNPELENALGQAFGLLFQGQVIQARALFEALKDQHPQHPFVWSGWGQCIENSAPQEALKAYHKALQLKPNEPEFLNNLGILEQKLGHYSEAIQVFSQLLAQHPHPMGFYNLALCHEAQQDLEQAISVLEQGIQTHPEALFLYHQLIPWLEAVGQLQPLKDLYQTLIKRTPDNARYYYELALISASPKDKVLYLQKAVQAQPDFLQAHVRLTQTYLEQNYPFAIQYIEAVCEDQPAPAYQCQLMSILPPPLPQSEEDIQRDRQRISDLLSELRHHSPQALQAALSIQPCFYLAYHGLNDRELLTQRAEFYRYALQVPEKQLRLSTRKRVGFVSCFFYDHSVSKCYIALAEAFQKAGFDVHIFYIQLKNKPASDPMLDRFKALASRFECLPELEFDVSRRTLLESELDFLIFTDIGMDPVTFFLALHRLAPVQMVLPGHPVTTGISTIDYFISPQEMEPPHAEEHYSEALVTLPGTPTFYEKPSAPQTQLPREHWGFSEEDHLYLCPMTSFKIHPAFDAVLEAILNADPLAQIVFFIDRAHFYPLLQKRFHKHLPKAIHQRIHFIPWQPLEDLKALIQASDLVLDPPYFGGGNTCYLCFALGTPMVTWPGPYMRGRGTMALYHLMGISNPPVARTLDHYAALAIETVQSQHHQILRQDILKHNHHIFEDPTHNQALVDFCLGLTPSHPH